MWTRSQLWTWTAISFFLNLLYWCIVDLQCCVYFCCTAKWFSYTYIYIHFQILFHYGLSQDIEFNSLCYTVGPCWTGISAYTFWSFFPNTISEAFFDSFIRKAFMAFQPEPPSSSNFAKMTNTKGKRRSTRCMFSRPFRKQEVVPLATYTWTYKEGDINIQGLALFQREHSWMSPRQN